MNDKSTRLHVIPLGFIENDVALNLLLSNQADSKERERHAVWHRVPSICLLIDHPKLGWVLVDTGSNDDAMEGYWPDSARLKTPLIRTKKDLLLYRLDQLGLTPSDIDCLILTHMHLDHAGGLYHFSNTKAGQRIIVHSEEIREALYDTFMSDAPIVNGYIKSDFVGVDGIHFDPIDDSIKMADDLELIWLPGHTAGTLAVKVDLKNHGTIIYTSDAVNWQANLGPPIKLSAVFSDSLAMTKSIRRIHWLQRESDALLIFGHDLEQFNKLKLSPDYYD